MSDTLSPALAPTLDPSLESQQAPPESAQVAAVDSAASSEPSVPTGASVTPVEQTTASGGVTAAPIDNTTQDAPLTSFENIPVNQLGPTNSFSAWADTNPNAEVYTGAGSQVKMTHKQIVGAIGDRLHIQDNRKSNKTYEEQVIDALAKMHSVNLKKAGITTTKTVEPPPREMTEAQARTGLPAPGTQTEPFQTRTTTLPADSKVAEPQWTALAQALHITIQPGEDAAGAVARGIGGVNTETTGKPQTQPIAKIEAAVRATLTDPSQIAGLQKQLEAAGYFTSYQQPGAAEAYTPGNWDIQTQQAFGQLLNSTAYYNSAAGGKKQMTWADMLWDQTASVNSQGGIASMLAKAPKDVTEATSNQMEQPALTAFEARLGRAPTSAELQALTGQYDAMQDKKASALIPGTPMYSDANGIPVVPGIASPTQEAANFAMQGSQTEYLAHQFANAGALIQNALVSGRPLGEDPNLTSASRPL